MKKVATSLNLKFGVYLISLIFLSSIELIAQISQEKISVVQFSNLTTDQENLLRENGIIGKRGVSTTYEVTEDKKYFLDQNLIEYDIIEEGLRYSGETDNENIKLPPAINGESSRTGSNSSDYIINDNSTAYSNISVSGAPTGAIATRISYSWNVDHDYVSDCKLRVGTNNWNDGDNILSKTGDDWLDGYNETSLGSRISMRFNYSRSSARRCGPEEM